MNVCIIGAGIAGLSCMHVLKENDISFDCYEKRDSLGGIWNYSDTEHSVYANCQHNHPRYSMGLNNIEIDNSQSDYVTHGEYYDYLKRFESSHIQYNCTVSRAEYTKKDACWKVHVNGTQHTYTHLVVCTGHYTKPRFPALYQTFSGETLHSKYYKRPESFEGKRVLVVGGGSSAIQIASDLVGHAHSVSLSIRKMPFIMPRYIDGQILLEFYQRVKHLQENDMLGMLEELNIDQTMYGIRKPEQGLLTGSTVPICDHIFSYVRDHKIQCLTEVQKIEGQKVFFDASADTFDSIIICTGYTPDYPFFNFSVQYTDNEDFLINKKYPHLYFMGMVQPVGPVPPLLQAQARIIAKLIVSSQKIKNTAHDFSTNGHRVLLGEYLAHMQNNYEI